MKRASNATSMEAEEFERRMEALYEEIFPEHNQCGDSCAGHQLPDMATRFLKEMEFPADLKNLTIAARSWFERIDLYGSGSIDRSEDAYIDAYVLCKCLHTFTHSRINTPIFSLSLSVTRNRAAHTRQDRQHTHARMCTCTRTH